jgi:hypothetical protein
MQETGGDPSVCRIYLKSIRNAADNPPPRRGNGPIVYRTILARQAGEIGDSTYGGTSTRQEEHIRFTEEPDQIKQALLEIYCAVALATPYNDFSTH